MTQKGKLIVVEGPDGSGKSTMLNKFKQSSEERMHDIKRNLESKRGSGKKGGLSGY